MLKEHASLSPESPRLRDLQPLPGPRLRPRLLALTVLNALPKKTGGRTCPRSEATLSGDATEEQCSVHERLEEKVLRLEKQVESYKESLSLCRASYYQAIDTLGRTITSQESVEIALQMDKNQTKREKLQQALQEKIEQLEAEEANTVELNQELENAQRALEDEQERAESLEQERKSEEVMQEDGQGVFVERRQLTGTKKFQIPLNVQNEHVESRLLKVRKERDDLKAKYSTLEKDFKCVKRVRDEALQARQKPQQLQRLKAADGLSKAENKAKTFSLDPLQPDTAAGRDDKKSEQHKIVNETNDKYLEAANKGKGFL